MEVIVLSSASSIVGPLQGGAFGTLKLDREEVCKELSAYAAQIEWGQSERIWWS